jgi:hypothetical protein
MKIMKAMIKGQKGQALVMALILLALGGLIIGPLLSYMDTGLAAGGVYERKAGELYAADAGVEDAIWKIQHPGEAGYLPCNPSSPARNYTISDVNGKDVDVSITYVSNITHSYHVESTATGDGSGTKIDAYITGTSVFGDFSGITNHVITSQGDINLKHGDNITPSEGENAPVSNYNASWPTAAELCAWYGDDVKNAPHYDSDTTINLYGVDQSVGPLRVNGELTIKNSGGSATLTLTGTIYATGVTLIGYGTSQNNPMILNLNGQTIFVASNSTGSGQEALKIGDKCTLVGAGSIIAVGDIYFKPNTEAGVTDPVFIMSVEGTSLVQPGGDFYGSIAGSVEVNLQPNTSLNYPGSGFGNINFPGCTAGRFVYSIASWEVGPPE